MATTIFLVNPQTFPSSTSYLLDTYTAAAAYSLRQLKTGVTNVVRVRRSSDNAESDFTATEVTDGTLTTWTGANDGFVVTWYDQSGSGNNVTQATAGSQPKLVSSGVVETFLSKPSLLFDGSNDYLDGGTSAANPLGENYLFTASLGSSNSTASGTRYARALFGANTGRYAYIQNNAIKSNTTNAISGAGELFNHVWNGTSLYGYLDNVLNVTTVHNVAFGSLTSNLYIGAYNNSSGTGTQAGYFMNGYISEVIISFEDYFSDRDSINTNINDYYGAY